MPSQSANGQPGQMAGIEIKDEDVFEAMKQIHGYLDITPRDFKEIYYLAYRHAVERLTRIVTAGEIMSRDVLAVRTDTPLAEVAAAMGQRRISGVPVLDQASKVVGVISEKDFLTQMGVAEPQNFMSLVARCLMSKGCVALPIKKSTAGDLMTSPAVCVRENTPVKDIAKLFTVRRINRVAVTDEAGRLLGIVTRSDLVKATMGGAQA